MCVHTHTHFACKTIALLALAVSLLAISSCSKDEDALTTKNQQKIVSNSKGSMDNPYERYETYNCGDTINGSLLIKFKDEVNDNYAEDKLLNLAIWQMETYFNIKYGIKDGVNGKFGGDIKDFRQFEIKVSSYTKGSDIYLSGGELINQYIIARDSIYRWLNESQAGLVLADFRVTEIKDNYVKIAIPVIAGIETEFPISPKKIMRPGEHRIYPSDFTTKYTKPFTCYPDDYSNCKHGGDWGYILVFNPHNDPVCVTQEWIPAWYNLHGGSYWWNHDNENKLDPNHEHLTDPITDPLSSLPYSLMGASVQNQNHWNVNVAGCHTNPETLYNHYKEWFIDKFWPWGYYFGNNESALILKFKSIYNGQYWQYPYNHIVEYLSGTPVLIHNQEYSQL